MQSILKWQESKSRDETNWQEGDRTQNQSCVRGKSKANATGLETVQRGETWLKEESTSFDLRINVSLHIHIRILPMSKTFQCMEENWDTDQSGRALEGEIA